jgi:hypothetical protein
MTAGAKKRDPLFLLGYASFTFGNMPLSLLEMTNVHRAGCRSNAVWHWLVPSFLCRRERNDLSAAPTRRAWPVMRAHYHMWVGSNMNS